MSAGPTLAITAVQPRTVDNPVDKQTENLVEQFEPKANQTVNKVFLNELREGVVKIWDTILKESQALVKSDMPTNGQERSLNDPKIFLRSEFDKLCLAVKLCAVKAPLIFNTDKGSLYIVGEDGSSFRMKPDQIGKHNDRVIREVMDRILFVDEDEALRIHGLSTSLNAGYALTGEPIRVIGVAKMAVPLEYNHCDSHTLSEETGFANIRGKIRDMHIGNKITAVSLPASRKLTW